MMVEMWTGVLLLGVWWEPCATEFEAESEAEPGEEDEGDAGTSRLPKSKRLCSARSFGESTSSNGEPRASRLASGTDRGACGGAPSSVIARAEIECVVEDVRTRQSLTWKCWVQKSSLRVL